MNQQIYDEASQWLVEFRAGEPDQAAKKRFDRWLSTSPEHVRAYLELTTVWETVAALPPNESREIDALIQRARSSQNVVPLAPGTLVANSDNAAPAALSAGLLSHVPYRRTLFSFAATVLLAIIAAGTYLYTQRDTYSTAVGEQRSILLPDGSIIDLNALSKVRIRLADHERHVDLLEGQALFRVAKDKTRPFIVAANDTLVRAVGTQFDINQRKRELIVTVVEGTVAVKTTSLRSGHLDSSGTLLGAGQQVTIQARLPATGRIQVSLTPRLADRDTATAWTRRRLIFDSTSLEDVAEEFNRNSERPLVIEGAGLEDFHISGAFSSADPQSLLRFLRAQPGVKVTERAGKIVVSSGD